MGKILVAGTRDYSNHSLQTVRDTERRMQRRSHSDSLYILTSLSATSPVDVVEHAISGRFAASRSPATETEVMEAIRFQVTVSHFLGYLFSNTTIVVCRCPPPSSSDQPHGMLCFYLMPPVASTRSPNLVAELYRSQLFALFTPVKWVRARHLQLLVYGYPSSQETHVPCR